MRKLWLVLTLVLAFTVAAVSAQAASVPSRLNGSTWQYAAFQFQVNGTANSFPSTVFGTQLKSTYAESDNGGWNAAKNVGGLNGTVRVWNATTGFAGANATWFNASGNGSVADKNNWRAGQTFGTVNELLELHRQPGADYSTYFIANTDYSLMASISNNTITGMNQSPGKLNSIGSALGLMVQNLTITNNVTQVAGTWTFYSITGNSTGSTGTLDPHTMVTAGQMTLDSVGGGSLSYYTFNGTGTVKSATSETLVWGNSGNDTLSINSTTSGGIGQLFTSGALSSNAKYLVGYNGTDTVTGGGSPVSTVIALKGASALSSSDFQNAGFKYAAVSTRGAQTNNATLGVFYTTSTGTTVDKGNATTTNGTLLSSKSLDSVALSLGTATLAGVSHSNMTMGATATGANFYASKLNNVFAGIVVDTANKAVGLQIMVPSGTVASDPVKLSTSETNTLNDTNTFTVTGSNGTAVVIETGTDASIGSLSGTIDTAVSNFTNATDDSIKTDFSLGSGATIDHSFPTVTIGATLGGAGRMLVRKITFGGNNKLISELPIPTKFYVTAVTTATGVVHAANTYKQFSYRNAGAAITDGSYWITPSGFPALTLNYTDANRLTLGSNYDMWFAIQDDGDFDLDATDAQIVDPAGFVAGLGGGGGIGSSSSSSGCVLNPAASLSVEFLLLLLAPLGYFIRRKK